MFPLISSADEVLKCPYVEELWSPISSSCREKLEKIKGDDWNAMDLSACGTPLYNKQICNEPQYRDRLVKAAKRIHDHRPLPAGIRRATDAPHPLNTHVLQIAEVNRIVYMPHGIHITPANGETQVKHPLFCLR